MGLGEGRVRDGLAFFISLFLRKSRKAGEENKIPKFFSRRVRRDRRVTKESIIV